MSVDVHDFRKYNAEKAIHETTKAAVNLLPQDAVEASLLVGDPKLDKLIQHLESILNALTPQIEDLKVKGMGCVEENLFRACQLNYVYAKGKYDAFKEIQSIPLRIMQELSLTK